MSIARCNQVWSGDMTSLCFQRGFLHLMAVMDWFSRFAWQRWIGP
jgi:putative transposase